jgi:signal transduction histidine kinase
VRYGIRAQLLVPLALLLAGLALACAWTVRVVAQQAQQQIITQVRNIAHTLSGARFPLTEHVLEQMKGLSGAEYLLDGTGTPPASTLPELPSAPELWPVTTSGADFSTLGPSVQWADQTYYCWSIRLRPPHPDAGRMLYILYPDVRLRAELWQAMQPLVLLGVCGGLTATILAVGVARQMGTRIQELERRTRLIAAGDFSPLPLPAQHDELRDLARSVNEMAEQLARLQEAVQKNERLRLLGQLSGGLAHQLRNGVTGARLAVQLHARACPAPDTEDLHVSLRQLALVEANLRCFLDLGRTDANELRVGPCDLAELVSEAVALVRPQCQHTRTALHWQTPGAVAWVGDAGRLRHLIINLLSNALEAAGPGGWVRVALSSSPTVHTLMVSDSGAGPPVEVAERLFEAFVTGKREGVGLGLAVAQQAAHAHGGQIRWQRSENATHFVVTLPADTVARRVS